jgi:hypothetical protein
MESLHVFNAHWDHEPLLPADEANSLGALASRTLLLPLPKLNVSHIFLAGHRSFCGKQPKSYGFCSAVRSSGGSQPSETVLASRFLPRFSRDFPVATVSSQKDMGKDQLPKGEGWGEGEVTADNHPPRFMESLNVFPTRIGTMNRSCPRPPRRLPGRLPAVALAKAGSFSEGG